MIDMSHPESGRLDYPQSQTSQDDEVLAAALNALHHCSGVPHDRIRVELQGGRAVLTGTVDMDYERALAAQAVANTPGVREVANFIALAS